MNTPSLHALLIDQHMGELAPEVVELLEAHLAGNASARAEAERIRQTLAITQQAVQAHPELARVGHDESTSEQGASPRRNSMIWLAKAAAIAAMAGLAGAGGYFAGQNSEPAFTAPPVPAIAAALPPVPRKDSPWARYQIALEPGGAGLRVVSLDRANTNPQ
jgi:hypothetical protein